MGLSFGNPAVYGYKFIIFFQLYIYASNNASGQCTKYAVMLREKTYICRWCVRVMAGVSIRARVTVVVVVESARCHVT